MNEPGGDPGEEVGPVLVVVEDCFLIPVEFLLVELQAGGGLRQVAEDLL